MLAVQPQHGGASYTHAMRIRRRSTSPLRRKARKGFRGYPIATVAFYGPTAEKATKVAVGIILNEGEEASSLERWLSDEQDVRFDPGIGESILEFIERHGAKSVVMTDGLIGCPHEEGTDYPVGESCPRCPYWAGRDRWSGQKTR